MSKRNIFKKVHVGTCGVDAGMIYIGDPCYVIDAPLGKKDWSRFLTELYATSETGIRGPFWTANSTIGTHPFPAGVVVRSGEGDGEYPVTATIDGNGTVHSVTITFIGEDDE